MAEISGIAGTRPVKRKLDVVPMRRQLIQVDLKVKVLLVRNKVDPSGKQTAQFGGFREWIADKLDAVPGVHVRVENAATGNLTIRIASVGEVYPQIDRSVTGILLFPEPVSLIRLQGTQVKPPHSASHRRQ